jgi:hypothetical protein
VTLPLLALLAAATAAQPPAGDAAKRAACTKAFENSLQLVGGMAATLVQAFADKPGQTPMARCMLESDVKKCLKLDDPAIQRQIAAAADVCMKWPDAYVACVADLNRIQTPACRKEWEAFEGLVSSEPKAEGPPPLWKLSLPARADHVVPVGDGVLIGIAEKEIFAVRDRKVAWRRPTPVNTDVLDLPGAGCVLVLAWTELFCLDPASGRERWAFEHPRLDSYSGSDCAFSSGAHDGGKTVVVDGSGRMYVLDERACAAGSARCLVGSGKLSGDEVATPALTILPNGDRIVLDSPQLVAIDRSGKQYASVAPVYGPLAVEPPGSLLLAYERASAGKKENVLIRFDPRRCKPGKSRDPLKDCAGIALGKTEAEHESFEAPAIRLPGGDLIVEAITLRRWGKMPWRVHLGAVGAPLLVGDRLYVAARDGADGKLALRAIDVATGRTLERSWIPGGGKWGDGQGRMVLVDGVLYLFAGKGLFAFRAAPR